MEEQEVGGGAEFRQESKFTVLTEVHSLDPLNLEGLSQGQGLWQRDPHGLANPRDPLGLQNPMGMTPCQGDEALLQEWT